MLGKESRWISLNIEDQKLTVYGPAGQSVDVPGWGTRYPLSRYRVAGVPIYPSGHFYEYDDTEFIDRYGVTYSGVESLSTETVVAAANQVFGRVVVLLRGKVPLVHKILHAQQLGALCVVIVDDGKGSCSHNKYDQRCMPGATKSLGERIGINDNPEPWYGFLLDCVCNYIGAE